MPNIFCEINFYCLSAPKHQDFRNHEIVAISSISTSPWKRNALSELVNFFYEKIHIELNSQ